MPDRTLLTWFTDTAGRHPTARALEVGDRVLSYAELSALVDLTARRLLAATGGTVPPRVALVVTRSVSTYAGYLAVLRLGGTVVPLNPAFPAERNAAILRSSGAGLVLAEAGAEPVGAPAPVLTLAADGSGTDPGGALPAPPRDPDATAYVLHTSGSTGRPKGVPLAHRCVSAYLEHVIPRYEIGPGCRLSQTFDLTFDPSVFDMFAAWGSGATLVVPSRGDLLAPAAFVAGRGITHWFSVPSVVSFAGRLRGLAPGAMPGLRWSLFAGEALTLQQARAWQAAAPGSVIENIYGPTELTVTCTEYRLPADPGDWPATANGTVPIGTLYPALEHVVLGEDGRPAADGELCVRGPQRFGGYDDPAENAGRFHAPDPSADGSRRPYDGRAPLTDRHWYRTGDRVVTEDGQLVHRGRLDHQLKVRGYRVELGEIEGALRDLPGVADAVVLPVTGTDGALDLVGVHTGQPLDGDAALDRLRHRLPDYMIPRRLVWHEELPLNANGKTDRAALAASLASVGAR